MSRPTQNCLILVLLMWTVVLSIASIIQGLFIVLFFTTGQPDQNSSVTAPEGTAQPQASITHSPPPSDDSFKMGEMLFYQFTEVDGEVRWKAKKGGDASVLAVGKDLKIAKDGYYFLNLRLTLFPECQCNGTPREACAVKLSHGGQHLIEGWINTNTCSTGLLGTVVELAAGSALNFTINMSPSQIAQRESLTHLAIVMLRRRPFSSNV
ncbi:uncharacterized protein LOC142892975 isoform X1 [Nelusetta ayraudi]|uniref:uncharacterized protein LOC142892975 isoform X1 n=1 Tax=Nelusetta ayraudi TaxID=303726 RepID=UPI003F6EBEBB